MPAVFILHCLGAVVAAAGTVAASVDITKAGPGLYICGRFTWFVSLAVLGWQFIDRLRRSWRRVKDWLRRDRR